MYEIEKNVTMVRGGNKKYPLRSMEVGDSFRFPTEELRKIRPASSYFGSRNNRKFACLKDGEGVYRCWRTA